MLCGIREKVSVWRRLGGTHGQPVHPAPLAPERVDFRQSYIPPNADLSTQSPYYLRDTCLTCDPDLERRLGSTTDGVRDDQGVRGARPLFFAATRLGSSPRAYRPRRTPRAWWWSSARSPCTTTRRWTRRLRSPRPTARKARASISVSSTRGRLNDPIRKAKELTSNIQVIEYRTNSFQSPDGFWSSGKGRLHQHSNVGRLFPPSENSATQSAPS